MKKSISKFSMSIILFSLLFAFSQSAFAHARWSLTGLVKPRTNATGLKEPAPCGGVARTNTSVVLQSGSTVDVQFEETINHPGHFRIAFSSVSDLGFNKNILVDNIPEVPATRNYTQTINLPNIECNDCTLQLIQVMTDRTPPSNYYSCADIQLTTTGTLPPPVADTTPPLDASSFSAIAGDSQAALTWQNPALDFSNVIILQDINPITDAPVTATRYKLNDTIGGATVIYTGNATAYNAVNLSNGSQYYFKVVATDASFNYSTGVEINTTLPASPENIQPLVSLTAEQSQTETNRILINAGSVIIQASVTDNNPSDTHQFDWSMTDSRLIDIDSIPNNFTFNPAELETGTYMIRVDVTDSGIPSGSDSATMSLEVVDSSVTQTPASNSSGGSFHFLTLFLCLLVITFRVDNKNKTR